LENPGWKVKRVDTTSYRKKDRGERENSFATNKPRGEGMMGYLEGGKQSLFDKNGKGPSTSKKAMKKDGKRLEGNLKQKYGDQQFDTDGKKKRGTTRNHYEKKKRGVR